MHFPLDDAEIGDVCSRDSKATPERLQRYLRGSEMRVVWVAQPAVILSLEGLHDYGHHLRWWEGHRDKGVRYIECNPRDCRRERRSLVPRWLHQVTNRDPERTIRTRGIGSVDLYT